MSMPSVGLPPTNPSRGGACTRGRRRPRDGRGARFLPRHPRACAGPRGSQSWGRRGASRFCLPSARRGSSWFQPTDATTGVGPLPRHPRRGLPPRLLRGRGTLRNTHPPGRRDGVELIETAPRPGAEGPVAVSSPAELSRRPRRADRGPGGRAWAALYPNGFPGRRTRWLTPLRPARAPPRDGGLRRCARCARSGATRGSRMRGGGQAARSAEAPATRIPAASSAVTFSAAVPRPPR